MYVCMYVHACMYVGGAGPGGRADHALAERPDLPDHGGAAHVGERLETHTQLRPHQQAGVEAAQGKRAN